MIVGVPKETKPQENRIAMTPGGAASLVRRGHRVLVEKGAGTGSGLTDEEFESAGAELVGVEDAWSAELVVKVKEPLPDEYRYLRRELILFTFLHLAAAQELTLAMLNSEVTGIAYETVQLPDGSLPLLTPMSEVAGRMAPQIGAHYLEESQGGRGVLLGGVPGVAPGDVVIVGAGVVGINATKIAMGFGARVTVLDIVHSRLQYLDDIFSDRVTTLASNEANLALAAESADLLIGAVLIPGARAPSLITRDMLPHMRPGAVIVDVAVDQGGCVETIKPTTHRDPVYMVDGVLHYGVANIPGAVPRTSTFALTNQTLPYVMRLAEEGLAAVRADEALRQGLNTHQGTLTCRGVGEALEMETAPAMDVL